MRCVVLFRGKMTKSLWKEVLSRMTAMRLENKENELKTRSVQHGRTPTMQGCTQILMSRKNERAMVKHAQIIQGQARGVRINSNNASTYSNKAQTKGLQRCTNIFQWLLTYFERGSINVLGRSPGLVVMGDDSCLRGHGFESRHRILDGHFFTFFHIYLL